LKNLSEILSQRFSGILISAVFHFLVLGASLFLSDFDRKITLPYGLNLEVEGDKFIGEKIPEDLKEEVKNPVENSNDTRSETTTSDASTSLSKQIEGADTLGLEQIYSESTLNVKINYPLGWTYIDQNVKSRLDGVTFLGIQSGGKEPPYVYLEVSEKYLFNAARFKQREEMKNAELFFNEPEEMEGNVTQVVYIRTKEEYDYSIKLTVKGYENFLEYQPVFFGMIKSFKFGSGWFWEKL